MSDSEAGGSLRDEGFFIMGSAFTGICVWMGLWEPLGVLNAAFIGFAALFFTYTMASAPRSLHTESDHG